MSLKAVGGAEQRTQQGQIITGKTDDADQQDFSQARLSRQYPFYCRFTHEERGDSVQRRGKWVRYKNMLCPCSLLHTVQSVCQTFPTLAFFSSSLYPS